MDENHATTRSSVFSVKPQTALEAIDMLFEHAALMHASDIHCDQTADHILVRMRIDGRLEPVTVFEKNLHQEMIARLKILSGARTDIHALPQDGRWSAGVRGEQYSIRISFMPAYHGESAVMRLLPARMPESISFARLGFTPDHVSLLHEALRNTSGLILVTGPTGSGKTTTLHHCLSLKSREPLSLITLEDPIEYEIPLVRQVHIRHTHGVTFASGLRSALRQDPDVIMVGEIRDSETAHIAVHTALTGHLVLSTLHTNSALETIPRLIDMGIDPYLLACTLKLVVAQRLVRMMCHGCFALGCAACRDTGYVGRSVIAEVCEIDVTMKDLISKKENQSSYVEHARTHGFRPMLEDGYEKVEWGITTREEVMHVLNQ